MELNEFIKKVAEQFEETDEKEFSAQTVFKKLDEWSSLEALCIIAIADDEFGVQLTNKDLNTCETIGDLYKILIERPSK